ncbi:response regulator transcription factor [Sphingomonas xinjiangensis]|uniref:Two-component system response regulator MtrA n=1 Tax=Sphingomonas xinjiangensis TaxID=643568 RepID=A0A840YSN5_9SPHN|nr:response regulator [Sphingomonas xinjiangensis]MBB5712684.1 two-component system response regulator MtrA [Sphingomonas xinjiangensis]
MARIVYVEDDEIVAELVKSILTRVGHSVTVLDHGTLAYDTIAFKKPDLVILDQNVPGMDGLDLLRIVRRNPSLYCPAVLMLSAKGGEDAIAEALSAGASDYLVKPCAPQDLVRRVERILDDHTARECSLRSVSASRADPPWLVSSATASMMKAMFIGGVPPLRCRWGRRAGG